MTRSAICGLVVAAAVAFLGACSSREAADGKAAKDAALKERLEQLVEKLLISDDNAALSEARSIFEREGTPSIARVGDSAAYGFVLVNMLGQSPAFREEFFAALQGVARRHEVPEDALAFAETRRHQTEIENRYSARSPSHPELRDQISGLLKDDQAVRARQGFDLRKMEEADRRTAGPLGAIFARYGVPTYEMVGVQAAKDFVVLVQHQPPEFRSAVLPGLKANLDLDQAESDAYAMVYDRTQRDQGKNQLYGQALECAAGKTLEVAPMDDAATVNMRRARMGLMRLELYARLVRLHSPDLCGAIESSK